MQIEQPNETNGVVDKTRVYACPTFVGIVEKNRPGIFQFEINRACQIVLFSPGCPSEVVVATMDNMIGAWVLAEYLTLLGETNPERIRDIVQGGVPDEFIPMLKPIPYVLSLSLSVKKMLSQQHPEIFSGGGTTVTS